MCKMSAVCKFTESLERGDLSPLSFARYKRKAATSRRTPKCCRHFKSNGRLHSALICTGFNYLDYGYTLASVPCRNHCQARRKPIPYCSDDNSLDHDFPDIHVSLPGDEGRCGSMNERQDPVLLRFILYQGANLPVLSSASYRGRAERRRHHRQTSCQSQKPRCPALQTFSVRLHQFQTSLIWRFRLYMQDK